MAKRITLFVGIGALLVASGSTHPTKLLAQNQEYTATQVKESFGAMARPGGAWVTSNLDYWTPDSGEPPEYLMRFTLEADGFVQRGCMWGRSDRGETGPFWTFYHAWDPVARAVLAYQVSPSGAVAVGHERPHEDGHQESIQEIVFPGAAPQRVRHLNRALHRDTLFSQSFDFDNGEWLPRRTYTWIWQSNVSSNPCLPNAPVDPAEDPLGFLEPLMGTWVAAPEWLANNSGVEGLIPLALDWGPSRHSVTDQSGLHTEHGRLFTFGTIMWNPASRRAVFTASQSNDDLFFDGFYEPVDSNTVRRTYAVHYPDRTPIRYRETFYVVSPTVIDWYTEWEQDGQWVPRRGSGEPEFRAVRPTSSPRSALEIMDRFVGKWRRVGNPSEPPAIVSIEWGTGRQWVVFQEQVEHDGVMQVTTAGMVAFDPHDRSVAWRGQAVDGSTIRGNVVAVDSVTIARHRRSYGPDGTINFHSDTWRWDTTGSNCFDQFVRGSGLPSRWCRV